MNLSVLPASCRPNQLPNPHFIRLQPITGSDAVLSVSLFFFATRLRKMIGPTFSTLHARANRSNAMPTN